MNTFSKRTRSIWNRSKLDWSKWDVQHTTTAPLPSGTTPVCLNVHGRIPFHSAFQSEILEPYFNTSISHILSKILTFLLAPSRTKNQPPNIAATVSPTNRKIRHDSRSTYITQFFVWKGSGSRDFMMSLPSWLHSKVLFRLSHNRNVENTSCHEKPLRSSDQTTTSFTVLFPTRFISILRKSRRNLGFFK